MAQDPLSDAHGKQIQAGIVGRQKGHKFEATLATEINKLNGTIFLPSENTSHLLTGNPAFNLLQYIANNRILKIVSVKASWLGGLATSGYGDILMDANGNPITKSKSDVLLELKTPETTERIGLSVKHVTKRHQPMIKCFSQLQKLFVCCCRITEFL